MQGLRHRHDPCDREGEGGDHHKADLLGEHARRAGDEGPGQEGDGHRHHHRIGLHREQQAEHPLHRQTQTTGIGAGHRRKTTTEPATSGGIGRFSGGNGTRTA